MIWKYQVIRPLEKIRSRRHKETEKEEKEKG